MTAETDESPSFVQSALGAVKSKGLRYSMVSVVNVITGQTLLLVFQKVFGWSPTWANVVAVCISAVPAYYLSRLWVWGKTGRSHFRREVLPFWIFVAIGLVFSTVCVKVMHVWWVDTHPGEEQPAILTNIVNIFAFGILWVLRFFLFDKLFHLDQQHLHGPFDDVVYDGDDDEADVDPAEPVEPVDLVDQAGNGRGVDPRVVTPSAPKDGPAEA